MVSINPEIMNGGGPLSKTGYVEPEDVKSAEVSAAEAAAPAEPLTRQAPEEPKQQSLYEAILAAKVDDELPRDFSLPSAEEIGSGIKWADGAGDGVYLYHMQPTELSDAGLELMERAVMAASDGDYEKADALFEELGAGIRAISAIDDIQTFVMEHKEEINAPNLHRYSIHLITESTGRESVKFGLSILELFSTKNNAYFRDVVRNVGLCDEFTLFSLFIMKLWDDGNEEIFKLAKKVHGWGRIHAIERLKPETDEIKRWLLLDGVHNDVMPAYSALTCWEDSDAWSVLQAGPTREEFSGIRDIIEGLMDEGPVLGISTLDNDKEILGKFLEVAETMDPEPEDEAVIKEAKAYIS